MIAMRTVIVLCCLVVAAIADEKYTGKYDNIDIDEILNNKRLMQAYVDCMLDKGKCTPEGKELKDHLEDALKTGCEKCTEKQRAGAETVLIHLIKNEPENWKELCAKYDPEGIYRKKYEAEAKAKGVTIPE